MGGTPAPRGPVMHGRCARGAPGLEGHPDPDFGEEFPGAMVPDGRVVTLSMNPETTPSPHGGGGRETMKIKEIQQIYVVIYKIIPFVKMDLKNFLSENCCLC